MNPRCGSCSFFKSHKPVTPGAGGNSECLRTPGYYRSPVMDSCKFYAKKGKKKVAKNTPEKLCGNCKRPLGRDGELSIPGRDDKVCFSCYDNLCGKPGSGKWFCTTCSKKLRTTVYLSPEGKRVCLECYNAAFNKVEAEARAAEHFTCVNCECHTQGKAYYRKDSKKPLCTECYEYLEKTMSKKPAEVPKEAPKRVVCVNCGRKFKTTLAVRGGAEPVCFSCRKKDKKLCSACGKYEAKGLTDSKGNSVCYYCHNREMPVTENPIHERYLIVEGRGAWPCANVYVHDFSDRESAFKFVVRYRPDTCKMFRVSSSAPIMLEELSLGYEVKVVSTHEMKESPK